MEGSLFLPPNGSSNRHEQLCPECGQLFQPRQVGDGLDELCDTCYDAQFQPLRLPRWKKGERKPHSLRMPALTRPRRTQGPGFAP